MIDAKKLLKMGYKPSKWVDKDQSGLYRYRYWMKNGIVVTEDDIDGVKEFYINVMDLPFDFINLSLASQVLTIEQIVREQKGLNDEI